MAATRATAAALAELHRRDTSYGEAVTLLEELSLLRRKHDKLAAAMGVLDEVRALDRIEAAAAVVPDDPLRPAHHSFRPAQVLLTDNAVAFIDFDKFCQAEPASDIAALTTKLQHMGMNKIEAPDSYPPAEREQRVAELRVAFLDEYRRSAAVSAARLAVWEALELFSLVLSAAKKMNRSRVDSCARMLERHLEAHDL